MDERAKRAAENIVAGVLSGGNDVGLVFKPEGEPAFVAAIIEAIENEYPPEQVVKNRVPIQVTPEAHDALNAYLYNESMGTGESFSAFILKAIQHRQASISDPSVVQLIEEARECVRLLPDGMMNLDAGEVAKTVRQLCGALEQQVTTRGEAEREAESQFKEIRSLLEPALDDTRFSVIELARDVRQKLTECRGKPHSSKGTEGSHRSQLDYLHHVLAQSTVILRCRDGQCNFALEGPYCPPSFCAKCQREGMLVAEPVLELQRKVEVAREALQRISRQQGHPVAIARLALAQLIEVTPTGESEANKS